jgi:hypothetical protein
MRTSNGYLENWRLTNFIFLAALAAIQELAICLLPGSGVDYLDPL